MRRLLALALLPLLAVPAGAQQEVCLVDAPCRTSLELVVRPPGEALRPGDDATGVPVEVRYTFFHGAPSPRPTRVDLEVVEAPDWLEAVFSPSALAVGTGMGCACSRTETAQAVLLLTASIEAPAFTRGTLVVTARARENGFYEASETTTEVPVEAGFLGLTGAELRQETLELAPRGTASLPMEVANGGNGAVRLSFSVESAPRGVRVNPPPPSVLDAAAGQRAPRGTVTWVFEGGGSFDEGEAVLLVQSVYARDATVRGDEVRVPVQVLKASGGVEVTTALGAGGAGSPLGMGILTMAAGLALYYDHKRKKAS